MRESVTLIHDIFPFPTFFRLASVILTPPIPSRFFIQSFPWLVLTRMAKLDGGVSDLPKNERIRSMRHCKTWRHILRKRSCERAGMPSFQPRSQGLFPDLGTAWEPMKRPWEWGCLHSGRKALSPDLLESEDLSETLKEIVRCAYGHSLEYRNKKYFSFTDTRTWTKESKTVNCLQT